MDGVGQTKSWCIYNDSWNNQVELKLQSQLEQADIHKCSTQVHALQLNYTLPGHVQTFTGPYLDLRWIYLDLNQTIPVTHLCLSERPELIQTILTDITPTDVKAHQIN